MKMPNTITELIEILKKCRTNNNVSNVLRDLSLEEVGDGAYSCCFKFKRHVVKVGYGENYLKRIGSIYKEDYFKKYSVPVRWIHPKGFALICPFVNIQDYSRRNQKRLNKFRNKAIIFFEEKNISLEDLHEENLVIAKYRGKMVPKIIDYGCFRVGNYTD